MIVLRNLCKSFTLHGRHKVVADNINATFPSKVSVALLGRNGAGKSTLLRMIAGTSDPTSGEILSTGSISFPIGFGGSFHPDMTGAQNTRFVARIYGVDVDAMIDYVEDFAELGPHFHLPLRTYSSGMRSRLSFGVSMALRFDTYLIDEITAVGDSGFKKKSGAVFRERMKDAAGIFVSHSIGTVRELCKAGAVLENGQLTYFDDVEEAIERHNFNMDGPKAKAAAAVRKAALSVDPETDDPTAFPVDARMLFCIGAQYAGVDALSDHLRGHRACHFPQKRELHYFDILQGHAGKTLRRRQRSLAMLTERLEVGKIDENRRTLQLLAEETALLSIYTGGGSGEDRHRPYLDYLLRGRRHEQLICDFTPTYGHLTRSDFAEMAAIGTARFLFILRDPVDRLWAQIEANVPPPPPAEGKSPEKRKAEHVRACVQAARALLAGGKLHEMPEVDYGRTLRELEAAVVPGRLHYAFYETLFAPETLAGISRFLGISDQPPAQVPDLPVRLDMPVRLKRDLRQALSGVYDEMRARFGSALPETWRFGKPGRAGAAEDSAEDGPEDEDGADPATPLPAPDPADPPSPDLPPPDLPPAARPPT